MNTTNFLLILLGSCLILCFILMLMNNNTNGSRGLQGINKIEGFDPIIDSITSQMQDQSPEELQSTVKALQQRLVDYGYAQDLKGYVKKTELKPNDDKCLVSKAEDRDKYVSKSEMALPGPRIDLSQYVKKSSIPPQTVCPPQQEIDYSQYVKKSTLPPNEQCPPCIAPKVKVSAGLCRECPPAPSCPPPERCPEIKCPPPAPCPATKECTKCDEIRYIKVPAVITKTITLDSNGAVVSQKVDSGNSKPTIQSFIPQSNLFTMPTMAQSAQSAQSIKSNQFTLFPNTTQFKQSTQFPNTTQSVQSTKRTQSTLYPTTTESTLYPTTTQSYIDSTLYPTTTESTLYPTTTESIESTIYPTTTQSSVLDSIFGSLYNNIPTTTFPVMSDSVPNVTLAQSLNSDISGSKKSFSPSSDLNSEFKSYGIYGM